MEKRGKAFRHSWKLKIHSDHMLTMRLLFLGAALVPCARQALSLQLQDASLNTLSRTGIVE